MKARLAIILVIVTYVVLEASSGAALFFLSKARRIEYAPISVRSLSNQHRKALEDLVAGRTTYIIHSPTLGWTIKPNGFSQLYKANAAGLRANREYLPSVPPGVFRLASFGDSFTHGDRVENKDSWSEMLAGTVTGVEVLNFGVPGYGLDQALLRYQQEGSRFEAHVVLIGLMSENLYRHVNVFRPFYVPATGEPLAKPRYVLRGDRLTLVENPMRDLAAYQELLERPERVLPRLGTHDRYFQLRYQEGSFDRIPSVRLFKLVRGEFAERQAGLKQGGTYKATSEAFRVTVGIVDVFVEAVARRGAVPVIVVFPNRGDILQHRKNGATRYAPLLADFRAKGYRYIDLLETFSGDNGRTPIEELIPHHYSPQGNRVVAGALWRYLTEHRLVRRQGRS